MLGLVCCWVFWGFVFVWFGGFWDCCLGGLDVGCFVFGLSFCDLMFLRFITIVGLVGLGGGFWVLGVVLCFDCCGWVLWGGLVGVVGLDWLWVVLVGCEFGYGGLVYLVWWVEFGFCFVWVLWVVCALFARPVLQLYVWVVLCDVVFFGWLSCGFLC